MSEATTRAALMTEHRDYIDGYAAGLADGRRIAPQPAVPVVSDERMLAGAFANGVGYALSRNSDLACAKATKKACDESTRAILAMRPAVEPMTERWAVVRETVLDVGRGSDVRTGGRPELGYALISDAATFDNEADAVAAINSTGLPVGWVVMPLSRLLPDTFGIAAKAEGGA